MNKNLKNCLSLMFLTSVLFSCGTTTSTSDTSMNTGDGDINRDENGNVIYKDITLKMWSVTTGDDAATQDEIISDFNELYSGMIKVEVEHHSRYDLEQLLNTTMQFDKKNAPDLMFNHGSRASEYNARGWLTPCETYFEKANVIFDKSDFSSSLLSSVTLDGKVYGMPIDCHSAMVEIRTDILEKNNLSIPTNYQELVDVCDKAAELASNNNLWIRGENSDGYASSEWRKASTAEAYTAFPISYGDMWVHEFFGYTAIVQNGADIIDTTTGMPKWYSKESNEGLQLVRDWVTPSDSSLNNYAMSKDYGSTYDVGDAPFRSGTAIFKLQGPWSYQKDMDDFDSILAKDGGKNNITTRSMSNLLAKDNSKEYASKVKGEGHAIMMLNTISSMTKACASAVFMDYMAYNSGIKWAKRGHIPAAQSVAQSEAYTGDEDYKSYIKYWGTPNDYVVVQPTPYYSYVDQYFKNGLNQVMSSQYKSTSVDDIMKKQFNDCKEYIELFEE